MAFGYNKIKAKVRPVKKKKEKLVKPNINELKKIYRILSRQAEWTNLDVVCEAMRWWDNTVIWMHHAIKNPSSKQSKLIARAMKERRAGIDSNLNTEKLQHYVNMIRMLEKAVHGYLKVPLIAVAVKKSQGFRIKLDKIKNRMAPKFSKLINILHSMFPTSNLLLEVVPYIKDLDGVYIPRKFDHALGKMFYSRAHAKTLIKLTRQEGILAMALQESFFLSRAMSYQDLGEGSFKIDNRKWVENHAKLLQGFLTWAKREDSPKRLVKKISRKAKIKIKSNHSEKTKEIGIFDAPIEKEELK